uniref:Transcription factor CBF/NF-Y/archaeal histone domain-containing protein n=1 Tax=Kalanchoe fedtschenkoi TaxID=63787 RepID=A0A7N0UCR0_KALFE
MDGGSGGGGFHGFHRFPVHSSPGMKLTTDMNVKLPEIAREGGSSNGTSAAAEDGECTVREQDRFMPIANVIRIMRKILPSHAKISDDAKETIQECVSEYISFITSEANERCQQEQRKTITAEDVLWAMSKLGFDDYIEPLTLYLHRYRDMEGDRGAIRGDPLLVKRAPPPEYGMVAAGYGAFPAAGFHMGHHHGFFGPPGMGMYYKDMLANGNGGGPPPAGGGGAAAEPRQSQSK